MQNSIACSAWAQHEFGSSDLGDKRRTKRLIQVATALASNPTGTLPPACSSWAELKGAYRLLAMESVSFEKILCPHWADTREACTRPGVYLVIEDTTSFDYTSHQAIQGMGRIGDDHCVGFFLHSALVLELK